MTTSGIGVLQAQLLQQLYSQQDPLEQNLLNLTQSYISTTPFNKVSIHMEIELKDGTKMNIDYVYAGMTKKTSYELERDDNNT
jgi:hypothetical protein